MSLEAVHALVSQLPVPLQEQVIGYARSVRDASGEICREARVRPSAKIQDQLVFLAGLRRLYALAKGSYWILRNSNEVLEPHTEHAPTVGRTSYGPDSEFYRGLTKLGRDLDNLLAEQQLTELMMTSWKEAAKQLANGR